MRRKFTRRSARMFSPTPSKKVVQVKNPLPLNAPEWGDHSNDARLLVPFSFTTKYSMNKDVVKY